MPDDLPALETGMEVVDCLPRYLPGALRELSSENGKVLALRDLKGMTQETYAQVKGLLLPNVMKTWPIWSMV